MLAGPVRAQSTLTPDEYNALVAAVESTPSQPANAAPMFGNFYTITHGESWPPLPSDTLGLNFWSLGGNVFLLDDRDFGYSASRADASFEPPFPTNGVGGGSGESGPDITPQVYTTNDLWLQITNLVGSSATLLIHPPSGVTEGVYDVLTATNLTQPIDWQWLIRTDPGQTNLPISIGTNAGTFYALGKPNDFVANDSLGTNFWLVFPSMLNDGFNSLSLYISSPVGASGTVTIPNRLNGSLLIVTNCGDTNVNGTYILTNMLINPFTYGIGGDGVTNGYVFSHYVVFFDDYDGFNSGYGWVIADASMLTVLFDGSDSGITNLNEMTWFNFIDTATPPMSICAQISLIQSFTVSSSNVTRVTISSDTMINSSDTIGTNNAIQITASAVVSVYAVDYDQFLSAAFTALPTTMLGTNYCVIARPGLRPHSDFFEDALSEFAIVATEDDTTVTITPSTTAGLDGFSGAFTTNLDAGETYQINSSNELGDVTGTFVRANKPVAVFAGASHAYVPDTNTQADNPLVQQQFPVEDWGTNVLALSFAGRTNGDGYRLLAAQDDTVISITGAIVRIINETPPGPWRVTSSNGTVIVTNQAGQFYDVIVDGPVEFRANKPMQVAQFANGASSDHGSNPLEGDPCEIILLPTDHYLETNVVFTLPNDSLTGDFDKNYLNIIIPWPCLDLVDSVGVTHETWFS